MTTSTNESDDLLKNIFNINDVNQDGCITIHSFLTIIKENWPNNLDDNVSERVKEFEINFKSIFYFRN
jgi:Ca2+-binding EF-hand superfamily protein